MRAYDIIRKKRDGERLDEAELRWAIAGICDGSIPDYQTAALTMAIFLKGLDAQELAVWTDAMMRSGQVMDLSSIEGIKVDKHSTGGVGDKISLPLAPLVAACGVPVPMISGRGLGHTGGTLDKLESIPGFSVHLDPEAYVETVATIGLCLIGQTDDLCPADRKLYALRDVTATVDSVPLISSSILCKKMAEGIDALVLDVKVGSGAFMKTLPEARHLAETMVAIGTAMGRKIVAYITDMDQPLGRAVGNALEIRETLETLRGNGPKDVLEVTMTLGAEMLVLGEVAPDLAEARLQLARAIESGQGLQRFRQLIAAQGGDPEVVERPQLLPSAASKIEVPAPLSGFVCGIDTEAVGVAALVLGAGRETQEASIDPAVGLIVERKCGERVEAGQALVTLHVNDRQRLAQATELVTEAYRIEDQPPGQRPLIVERIDS